jgi:hypothetical protein
LWETRGGDQRNKQKKKKNEHTKGRRGLQTHTQTKN